MGRWLVALGLVALVAGSAIAETLAESLAELTRRSREYEESLTRLLELQEQAAARAAAAADRYRELHPKGLVSRRDVETAERAAAQAHAAADDTRERLTEAGRLVTEAHALLLLTALPPLARGEERATSEVIQHAGRTGFTLARLHDVERFFAERFGRPLPISALGQTAVHDRLGFDHRNAADVAVHPDSVEGRALLAHLRASALPFLAFRSAVPGVATGAHVHIGPPSGRKG